MNEMRVLPEDQVKSKPAEPAEPAETELNQSTLFEPAYNYLTGEELKPGQVVGYALGGVAHYSSISGESFKVWGPNRIPSLKCYRETDEGKKVFMHVTQEEWQQIEQADKRWKKVVE